MSVALARHAMATRFEMILEGGDPMSLRAAGEEALAEVERLESRLSLFRQTSEIAEVNACAAHHPVRISPEVFHLLLHARDLHRETLGAFDITVGPLMRCWGFHGGSGHLPPAEVLQAARACVGFQHLTLNQDDWTVSFDRPGVSVDLGAIGKGYALDCVVEILRSAGILSGFVHAGTSSVVAIGCRETGEPWKVAVTLPGWADPRHGTADSNAAKPLATIELKDEALSVSGMDQKFFQVEGRTYGHIIDPRTGSPATQAHLSTVVLRSATDTDALSTALLVAGLDQAEAIFAAHEGIRALVAAVGPGGTQWLSRGIKIDAKV